MVDTSDNAIAGSKSPSLVAPPLVQPGMGDTLLLAAPIMFVLLWSTGWICARFIVGVVEPLTFLLWRFGLSALALAALVQASGAGWPSKPRELAHMLISGVLIQALYLGTVWWAVANGVPAGLSGLIAALQPIFTAVLAPVILGELVTRRQWGGIALSLFGILLVLSPKLISLEPGALSQFALPMSFNVIGMLSVTLGTFYQKRFIPTANLLTSTAFQNIGAFCLVLPLAAMTETLVMHWTPITIAVMAWSVVGLSMGATMLFFWMIRRGAVTRAASLIYLMPPAVAIEAYALFGERMTLVQVTGLLVTVVGVALTVKR
jgi:drug/metabolite transporter (DMT)-like permease